MEKLSLIHISLEQLEEAPKLLTTGRRSMSGL